MVPSMTRGSDAIPIGLSISSDHARPSLPIFLSLICLSGLKCWEPKLPPLTIQLLPLGASLRTLSSFTFPAFDPPCPLAAELAMTAARIDVLVQCRSVLLLMSLSSSACSSALVCVWRFAGMEPSLLIVVRFPGQVDDVGVHGIGVLDGHFGLDERPARARRETGIAILTMTAAEHDAEEWAMNFRRHIAQIRNGAVDPPRSGAV